MNNRLPTASILVLLAVLSHAGCGLGPEESARPIESPGISERHRGPVPTVPNPSESGEFSEKLFLVREGHLVPVMRSLTAEPTAESLISDLLAGPTDAERSAGITSALSGTTLIKGVRLAEERAVIELAAEIQGNSRTDEVLAFAQVVCTLTSLPGISHVSFVHDQQLIGVPRADGSLSQRPLSLSDYASLITG